MKCEVAIPFPVDRDRPVRAPTTSCLDGLNFSSRNDASARSPVEPRSPLRRLCLIVFAHPVRQLRTQRSGRAGNMEAPWQMLKAELEAASWRSVGERRTALNASPSSADGHTCSSLFSRLGGETWTAFVSEERGAPTTAGAGCY